MVRKSSYLIRSQRRNWELPKIHQELQIVPELSVAENIFLGRWKTSAGPAVDFKAMKDEAKEYIWTCWMCMWILQKKAERSPYRRAAALWRSQGQFLLIPKIIVMDEPTSAISEKAAKLFTIIRRLRGEGKGSFILHIEWKRYLRLRTGLRLCAMASISAQSRQRKHQG